MDRIFAADGREKDFDQEIDIAGAADGLYPPVGASVGAQASAASLRADVSDSAVGGRALLSDSIDGDRTTPADVGHAVGREAISSPLSSNDDKTGKVAPEFLQKENCGSAVQTRTLSDLGTKNARTVSGVPRRSTAGERCSAALSIDI